MRKGLLMFGLLVCAYVGNCREFIGVVSSEVNDLPLEYVNVVVLRGDSTFICGAVTDSLGRFSLAGDGIKILNFKRIGYEVQTIPVDGNVSLPLMIKLPLKEAMLGEVDVTSRKPRSRLVDGVMEMTVAGTPLTDMLSVYDLFQFVPMLSVQGEKVEVFGKGIPVII